jgi:hypothetical protein
MQECAIVNSHGIVNGATISVFEHISNDEIELVDEMKPVDFKPVSHKIRLVTHS